MEQRDFSFKKYAWSQFKKNKPALYSLYILLVLVVIAIFAPIIANDQPLYCKYKGETYFPAFADMTGSWPKKVSIFSVNKVINIKMGAIKNIIQIAIRT